MRTRPDHRRRRAVRADLGGHHGRRAARRRSHRRASRAGPSRITLPAGQQELLISPGAAFVVDGAQLAGPLAHQLHTAPTAPAHDRRMECRPPGGDVEPSQAARVLVVPESVNPGWTARTGDGTALSAGHGQRLAAGLGAPAGHRRARSRWTSRPTALYRAGLVGGLALLPLLAAAGASSRCAGRVLRTCPARPWQPGPSDGERRGGGGRSDDLRGRRRRRGRLRR